MEKKYLHLLAYFLLTCFLLCFSICSPAVLCTFSRRTEAENKGAEEKYNGATVLKEKGHSSESHTQNCITESARGSSLWQGEAVTLTQAAGCSLNN